MKTGAIFLKALVIGGFVLSAANFSPEAQAATPLTAANKTTLGLAASANVQATITSLLAAAPAADREQLAVDILAHLGSVLAIGREQTLQRAVQTAVALVPNKAPRIAAAAAQAVSGRTDIRQADKGIMMAVILRGVKFGAPSEFEATKEVLVQALPAFRRDFDLVAPPRQDAPPVLPDGSNPFVTSPS